MFNDVVYFNDVKLKMLNRDVANLIYTLTGMRTFREIKRHFEEYPYEKIRDSYRGNDIYYLCDYNPDYVLDDSNKQFDFDIVLVIKAKTGEVMIRDIEVNKIRL